MSAGRRPWRQNWSGAGRGNRRGDRKQLGCSHRRSAGRRDVTRATRTFGYPSRYGPPTQRWPRVSHPQAIWGEKCRLLKERVKWLVPQALPQTWRFGCHRVLPNWRAEASICHASLRCAGSRFFNQKISGNIAQRYVLNIRHDHRPPPRSATHPSGARGLGFLTRRFRQHRSEVRAQHTTRSQASPSICHASLRCAGSRFFNQKIPATSLRGTCSTYDTITGLPPRPPRTQTGVHGQIKKARPANGVGPQRTCTARLGWGTSFPS